MTFPIDPAATPRSPKDLGRDIRWIKDQLKLLGSLRATLERGAVSGGVTTIREILTSPAGALQFVNSDSAVWDGTGDLMIPLGHWPWSDSLQVKLNGHELDPGDWTYDTVSNTVTIPAEGWWVANEEKGTAYYAWQGFAAEPAIITPTFRAAAPQNLNGFVIPASAEVGDLLVALAMMPTTESVTALNGWSFVGASDYVTHTAVGGASGGTRTYRLEAYTFLNDGSSVPTVSNVAAQDVVCSMAAFSGGSSAEAIFATVADATAAEAPAQSPTSLRVWGTISDTASLTAARGTTILSTNYVEIDTLMTIDDDPTPASATATATAGWCTASLAVRA